MNLCMFRTCNRGKRLSISIGSFLYVGFYINRFAEQQMFLVYISSDSKTSNRHNSHRYGVMMVLCSSNMQIEKHKWRVMQMCIVSS